VEETWLDAIPGELQKPYALTLSKFVESEISSGDDVVYPPTHLIFNALNSTPFDRVKAVILGQVNPFLLAFLSEHVALDFVSIKLLVITINENKKIMELFPLVLNQLMRVFGKVFFFFFLHSIIFVKISLEKIDSFTIASKQKNKL